MSKAHKRNQAVEIEHEEDTPSNSNVFSMAQVPLASFAAHRWKALAGVAVVTIGVVLGTGLVDFGKLMPTIAQNAPDRSGVADATTTDQPAEQAAVAHTPRVASKPALKTCFTPGENCMSLIVAQIDRAQSEILVQAYSFQAKPLVKALGRAHKRGVKVRVILDRGDERQYDRAGSRLIAERILPHVDTGVASAHNKVMIIDRDAVITGSFNFTEAAQKKNAENVLLIKGYPDVAAAYAKNWELRLASSRPYYGTMAPVM
ncbi:MAG: phospholipase D family protein [Alphaproteobacteria bacterium]|nr:phospholipase D family protein [Alphaproteobacteria bacterium]